MVHDIQWPGPKIATTGDGTGLVVPEGQAAETLRRKFGQPVDVVLFGDTHEELICHWDDVLIVNPGSPTYPGRRHSRGALGTIALLEINGEEAEPPASSTSKPESHQPSRGAPLPRHNHPPQAAQSAPDTSPAAT